MKKIIITMSLTIILTSCFGSKETSNTGKSTSGTGRVIIENNDKILPIKDKTGSVVINSSGSTIVTASGSNQKIDKETEDTLNEIDKIIDEISNEK